MGSIFNKKERIKTKNSQHKLRPRKRRDDEMKFNLTVEEKGKCTLQLSVKIQTFAEEH